MTDFVVPTQGDIVKVLSKHRLVRLRETVLRAFLIGSFAKGCENEESDVDILLEVKPHPGQTASELEEHYRQALRQYFVTHDIRGKQDSVHPTWCGRRVDVYFTYDADLELRPKVLLT
jgi:predicted nucleotidyltransferase